MTGALCPLVRAAVKNGEMQQKGKVRGVGAHKTFARNITLIS